MEFLNVVNRIPVSVSAGVYISDNQGRLLLLQQGIGSQKSQWGPPAGGMGPHEDPLTTAKRKTKKEIGVDVELIDLIGIYTIDRGDESSAIGFAFRGKLSTNSDLNIKKGEISDFKYFTVNEIKKLLMQGKIYKPEFLTPILEDWIKGSSYPLDVVKSIIQ